MKEYKENREMRILSAVGIILVTAGHLGYNLFDIGGLFPYYSFHVFLFLFVSGYFYKPESEDRILSYIFGKCVTLLLPYYIWNVIYGVLASLLHRAGFTIGQELSFYTLLVAPFDGGHQFMYQFPAWFVPVLFMIEVVNVCMRKVLSLIRMNHEWFIFFGCLILGIATVWLAIGGHVWGLYKIPGRILFMLPGFQMGRIYKEKLEKYDTLSDGLYFLLTMGIQLLITVFCGGLAFSAVWVSSFANGPVVPYLTVITGIAFWLRIAKIMNQIPYLSGKMVTIGRNTFSIMMHHIFAFFLVKTVFYALHVLTPLCQEFDTSMYFSEINFVYLPGGAEAAKWIYLLAGIGIPLLIAGFQRTAGEAILKVLPMKKNNFIRIDTEKKP
ncbi:MAG: acyltransferase family protein [Suilimivivens sp.]